MSHDAKPYSYFDAHSAFDELGRGEEGGGREGGWLGRCDLAIDPKEEELWEISPNTWMSPV